MSTTSNNSLDNNFRVLTFRAEVQYDSSIPEAEHEARKELRYKILNEMGHQVEQYDLISLLGIKYQAQYDAAYKEVTATYTFLESMFGESFARKQAKIRLSILHDMLFDIDFEKKRLLAIIQKQNNEKNHS